ncbi:hypothetical protein [Aureispira sp. CCB-E]|uniref:hypothetical protein n=1 Tax=Aureispira sp. CCB-E TaxID=3051121 RepID=UPI0028686C5C|nr:hypothetical protein [Aureispira sp. CCB-E]WMX17535.1 hypothetical protein QP953_14230 [Aureispira sp. CCB-E]
MKKLFNLLFIIILLTQTAWAQDVDVTVPVQAGYPGYLMVILSGVLLALGFQFFLTVLSVAAGVTTVGNLKKSYAEYKYDHLGDTEEDDDDDRLEKSIPMGVKVTSGIGVWNMLTVALSLLGATFFALKLVPMASSVTSISLSLVIWATFFMLLFYLESKMVGTALGGLIGTAIAGIKASGSKIASMFSTSPEKKAQKLVDRTIEKARKEFSSEFDMKGVMNSIKNFVDQQNKNMPSYKTLKKDLKKIAASVGKDANSKSSAAKWMAVQTIINGAIQTAGNTDTEEGQKKVDELKRLLAEIKDAYNDGNDWQESLLNVLELSPVDEENVDQKIDEIKHKIRTNTDRDMSPERIQELWSDFMNNPQGKINRLFDKMGTWKRKDIINLLDENTSLERSKIEEYATRIESSIVTTRERLGITNEDPEIENLLASFENKVRAFIDTTDAPELQYHLLKADVKNVLNNPNDSLDILKHRLNTFDRNTLVALLTNTPWIDKKDINNLADMVESAKNDLTLKLDKVNDKITSTVNNTERKLVIHAEHLRQAAVSASWWLVATILMSAAAAIGGGIMSTVV